jgi:hypothetical protein
MPCPPRAKQKSHAGTSRSFFEVSIDPATKVRKFAVLVADLPFLVSRWGCVAYPGAIDVLKILTYELA